MTINKRKVLFFVSSRCGGAERMTIQISKMLSDEDYTVFFYVIGKPEDPIVAFLPKNSKIKYIHKNGNVKVLKDFYQILKRERPNFVFSSLFTINTKLCFISLFFPRIKVIIRSDNYLYTLSTFQKVLSFLTYRLANKIIVQTDEMKNEFISKLKVTDNKVIMLSNPVDTNEIDFKIKNIENPFVETEVNYVFVGRIDRVKGVDVLIQSFSNVLIEIPHANLYLIGDVTGKAEKAYLEFQSLAKRLKIDNRVYFLGFQSNPYQYMKYADCLVLPSRNEGLPNVIIEALYLKTPVAATKCIPVISRIVEEGINGYLSEVDDYLGFSQAMINSIKIKEVNNTYQPATQQEFISLF